ncbi:MAG: transposase [Pleurocapsa sp. MO_226.B13]|nr:transposase [Pleurocapsa sp. MO_226.B13]
MNSSFSSRYFGISRLVRVRPAVKLRVGRIRFFTHCTKENLSDDSGLIEMLIKNLEYFRAKPVNLPKITILLDNGYHPEKLMEKLKEVYPQIDTQIRFELSPKPSKSQKKAQGKSGFVPVKARWVIERSNSSMERCIHFSQKF